MIFYMKSVGVLQDVLQDVAKGDFEGLMVEERWKSGDGDWMRTWRGLGPGK